jgi:hypothetical protein
LFFAVPPPPISVGFPMLDFVSLRPEFCLHMGAKACIRRGILAFAGDGALAWCNAF